MSFNHATSRYAAESIENLSVGIDSSRKFRIYSTVYDDGMCVIEPHSKPLTVNECSQVIISICSCCLELDLGCHLILDMTICSYLSSSALGQLVKLAKALAADNYRLLLVHVGPALQHIISLTNMDRFIELCDSVKAAQEWLSL